jgi:hypothetical protein
LFGKGQMRLFSTETGGVLSGPVIVWNSFGTVNNADVVGESTAAKMFRTRLHSYGSYAGPSVSVSGMLDAFGGAAYDVYVYIDMADGQNGSSAVQLGPVTYYLNDPTGHTFTGTYELASSTNPSSPQKGNYVRFAGVTGDAFTLTSTGSNRDGINGMQIVRSDTTPIQYPPQAGDDAVSTLLNQPVSINVLANDIDPNPYDTLGISAFTQGLHGTVSRVGSNLVYTPALDWSGVDVFTYTVTDGHDNFDTAGVTVSVNAVVNNPPVAVDDDVQTLIETPITIPVLRNDSDPDAGDTLSLYQVSAPSHGFAQISGTNILYSPAAEYAGQDVFSYTITDGRGGFGTAMVRMQVMSATTARAISVNYEYASSGADDLSVTDVAGAVPSTNWNNVHAASTTNLKDSAGSATTMDIAITGGNLGTYDSVVTPTTPDGKMMDGFYGTYNNSTPITMTLGEIPYAKYDVIVYWGGPPSDRTGTWTPSYSISAAGTATYYLKYSTPNNNVWDGAFSASTATTSSTATYGADYVRWNNLSGAAQTITVRIGGTTRFGISGIQIVEAVDAPKVLAFTRNDGQDVPERLDSVSFRFDQDVSASVNPTDISLFNETTQQDVSIAGATVEYNSVTNTARWDLSELDLPAGLYSVRLRAEGIRNFRDDALDGNGDGVGGDDYVVNHVLIAQRGDASLDGCVDVVDLGILATHYGQPVGAGWTTGDFNGDGAVDVTDLGLLATYYGTGVAMASPASESASDASDASLASEATEFSSSSNDSNALLVAMPLPAGTTTGSAAGETSVAATGETVSLWIEAMPGETGVVVAESSDEVDVLSMTGRAVMPMTEYPVVETPGELIPDVLQIIYSRCQ